MSHRVPDASDVCVQLPVPMERVGQVVGRGGDGLRAVAARTGCRITVDAKPDGGARLHGPRGAPMGSGAPTLETATGAKIATRKGTL